MFPQSCHKAAVRQGLLAEFHYWQVWKKIKKLLLLVIALRLYVPLIIFLLNLLSQANPRCLVTLMAAVGFEQLDFPRLQKATKSRKVESYKNCCHTGDLREAGRFSTSADSVILDSSSGHGVSKRRLLFQVRTSRKGWRGKKITERIIGLLLILMIEIEISFWPILILNQYCVTRSTKLVQYLLVPWWSTYPESCITWHLWQWAESHIFVIDGMPIRNCCMFAPPSGALTVSSQD